MLFAWSCGSSFYLTSVGCLVRTLTVFSSALLCFSLSLMFLSLHSSTPCVFMECKIKGMVKPHFFPYQDFFPLLCLFSSSVLLQDCQYLWQDTPNSGVKAQGRISYSNHFCAEALNYSEATAASTGFVHDHCSLSEWISNEEAWWEYFTNSRKAGICGRTALCWKLWTVL